MTDLEYERFLATKVVTVQPSGFEPGELSPHLFLFQAHIVRWALRLGRAAVFADTGLGKTVMEVEWAVRVAEKTDGQVLILAPLAVAQQTVREAARFGFDVRYVREQSEVGSSPVVITNYDRLAKFDLTRFAGVVLDESSILKSFMGKVKRALIEQCANVPYRLACTATPAPNDHMEIGNHAEFLGVMPAHEMLTRWFITDLSAFGTYRLKGHAVVPFWDWVASWAVCCSLPSDIGFSDFGYVLPELVTKQHVVDVDLSEAAGEQLFRTPDMSATSVHREKRLTAADRAAKVASIVSSEPDEQWIIWCDTDYEADALKEALPGATEVRGSHSSEVKERAALDFADGKVRVLISKSAIFGLGLNWQHCARVAFVGADFSYEKFYQAVRRCWRFGQQRPVHVHVVMAATEASVWSVLTRKKSGHDEMRTQMSAAMKRARSKSSPTARYAPTVEMRIPNWLQTEGV
jgi:superfamily II DNA or RNA helicase